MKTIYINFLHLRTLYPILKTFYNNLHVPRF